MILNDPRAELDGPAIAGQATLDDLFRLTAARRPDAVALVDPPNRETFAAGAPRRLTYAQADRIISALAGRLRRIGLSTDGIVAIQGVNTVESVLTLLAVLRAGLIAMPLPLLWRRADLSAALSRVAAGAMVVSGRTATVDQFRLATQVATDVFGVRHICGFGPNPPDGVIPLEDVFSADCRDAAPPVARTRMEPPGPAAHLAAVTFDVTADGIIPVGRSHAELIAAGLAVLLENRLEQDAVILSTVMMSSFATLATSLLPWLLVGGTLALHQPFDGDAFAHQLTSLNASSVIIPGPLVAPFAQAGQIGTGTTLKSVLAIWRAPDQLARAPSWNDGTSALIDVQAFGEIALFAARRGSDGQPAPIPRGVVRAPHDTSDALAVAETRLTLEGTLAMRGPMVPRCAFPPGAELTTAIPHLVIDADGFVDTGYPCQLTGNALAITAPPHGIISVGGYRFLMRAIEDLVAGIDRAGALAAYPDAIAGHRLAGVASDRGRVERALIAIGANPLVAGAFAAVSTNRCGN